MALEGAGFIYSRLFHKNPDAIFVIEDNIIVDCNEAAMIVFGVSEKSHLIGLHPYDLSPLNQNDGQLSRAKGKKEITKAYDNKKERFLWTHRKSNGEEFDTEVVLISKMFVDRNIMISIIRDISELRKRDEKISFLSYRDNLTGLYNKDYFIKHTRSQLTHLDSTQDSNENMGVLLLDINDFSSINDNLGYDIGDTFLKIIAKRLIEYLGNQGLVAKYGGDEFIILVYNVENENQLFKLGKDILKIFDEPFKINDYDFYMTSAIGISMFPQHGRDSHDLIKCADIAIHKAKEYKGNKVIMYDDKLNQEITEKFLLDSHLRYAIDNNELYLYYQPILEAKSEKIIGVEALVRWRSADLGQIPPNKFIPIAEGNGMILSIGEWILENACMQLKKWKNAGYNRMFLSINISIKQLEQKDFANYIINLIERLELSLEDIVLEITESVYMENLESIYGNLKKLNKLGIQISIDDFGTGYSSLGKLSKLEISKLKIDKSFIRELHTNSNNAKIVTAIISMAKSLNLSIVAEGVEEIEHTIFLRNAGCDMLQGFLFSKPVSPDEISKLLTESLNKE